MYTEDQINMLVIDFKKRLINGEIKKLVLHDDNEFIYNQDLSEKEDLEAILNADKDSLLFTSSLFSSSNFFIKRMTECK